MDAPAHRKLGSRKNPARHENDTCLDPFLQIENASERGASSEKPENRMSP
jgi:hypothetical protein